MLGVTDLWTFVLGTIAIILLPGPNSLFVLSTAAKHGVKPGYRAAAGVFVGDAVLMLAAAAGAASLLTAYPALFLVVKYAGAAYLSYVGVMMAVGAIRKARARGKQAATGQTTTGDAVAGETALAETESVEVLRPFRRALVVSLLNPKAILFFVSFFVQFVDPSYAYPAVSFLLLAGIVQLCSLVYLSVLIFGGTYLASQFRRRRRLAAGLTTLVGAVFIGFGVRLATASLS
jgi:leucine efflux protein